MSLLEKNQLSGKEVFFAKNDLIVSKTDLKGRITYANKTFINISGYKEKELLNTPHSILRHPDMPRCVFKLLWDTLQSGNEIFAYVINKCKNGDHYWVFAHVTPSFDSNKKITSYHSSRRTPDKEIVKTVFVPLYKALLEEEERHSNKKEGMISAHGTLVDILTEKGMSYDEFIFSL